jgi:hypothetical protein
MRARRLWFGILGTLALACLPAPAGAQPVGSEFQVNTSAGAQASTRGRHVVAADASGHFVVVWNSRFQDGSGYGIFGQRFDNEGVPEGSEFRVNSYTMRTQWRPSVASDASGNFVVVWQSNDQDGSLDGIFGQRYDSEGVAQGDEFRVNSFTAFRQQYPSVASATDGAFVVAWSGTGQDDLYGVFGQRYDSAGAAQGDEFRVNSYTRADQQSPSVASDASGNFVVVWESDHQDESLYGIGGQRYDSEGGTLGSELRVNSYTTGQQRRPSVGSDASGNFVVVWESRYQDGSGYGIFGQRFDSEGVAQGDEFRVNSLTTGNQQWTSVACDAGGNFVVAWSSYAADGDGLGVFGQRYDSRGVAQGGEFQINSSSTGDQWYPSVVSTGNNQFVVVWTSGGFFGTGGSVFGQRFDFGGDTIKVVSPSIAVKWRIGTPQVIQWTHNLGIEATFRIKLDRDDDGEYEELIAAAIPASSEDTGSFTWTVTGPPARTARVRVAWTAHPDVSDASDVTVQIKPAP